MCSRSIRTPAAIAMALAVLAIAPAAARAESTDKFGRLADGRAYRVDAQGYRLIDQVAELEVANDDLRRQLEAAELELAQKQSLIDRLQAGKPAQATVKEANLVGAKSTQAPDCSQVVSSLSMKVAKLESDLRDSKQGSSAQSSAGTACDYYSSANPLWNQVTRLQQELMKGPSDERYGGTLAAKEDLEIQLARVREQLKETAGKSSELASKVEEQKAELEKLRETKARQVSPAEEPAARSTISAKPAPEPAEQQSKPAAASGPSPAKKELQQQLAALTAKIGQRKALLDSLKSKGKGVAISAQPLVTKDGRSLDTLRTELRGLTAASDAAALEQGLQQITKLLDDDIGVLRRLNTK